MITQEQLLNEAVDYIFELVKEDDWICEPLIDDDDYCANNCKNMTKECVIRFLKLKAKQKEQ